MWREVNLAERVANASHPVFPEDFSAVPLGVQLETYPLFVASGYNRVCFRSVRVRYIILNSSPDLTSLGMTTRNCILETNDTPTTEPDVFDGPVRNENTNRR